jgi:hypothetical protein
MIKVISCRYSWEGWIEDKEHARITLEGHPSEAIQFAYHWLKTTMPENIPWFITDIVYEANSLADNKSRVMVRAAFK